MTIGAKVKDPSGNACVLTPEIGTIISAGRLTMPSGLVDTNKYYATVNLPATIPVADLSVLITPVKWTMRVAIFHGWAGYRYDFHGRHLDDDYTYYTKDISTGILTTWSAGNMTPSNPSTWHYVLCAYPLVYWELLGATSVSSIKLFAATCYCTGITATTSGWPTVYPIDEFRYSIYTDGVETIDYMILCKKYNY